MATFEIPYSDTFEMGESDDSISMFFDFDSPPPSFDDDFPTMNTPSPTRVTSPPPSKPTTTTTAPRGGIRVSLACIPCRSRHVKCGAETPACSRCQTDDKQCFYAKSRRGMRDRNAPKKSTSISDQVSPSPDFRQAQPHENLVFGNYSLVNEPWRTPTKSSSAASSISGSLDGRFVSALEDAQPTSTRRLIGLFYTYFYKAHPFVLPRFHFLTRLQNDPLSLSHLVTVISYIGSLYDPSITSTPFRDQALAQIDAFSLPVNGFSVQTLLLTALALHCDNKIEAAKGVLERATWMAVELGMNCAAFADLEQDFVLGESWRRTYWGICEAEGLFAGVGLGIRSAEGLGDGFA
ncbi:hypothetical protein HYALB_00012951 [Hymenoscyphus albidus]|uniref:Zn(2)-C6 fungal-type domain-containing protein n=1 Tax=Hymenoscyphus albidus TaxID=595503 RepID=A0A9N9LTT9_9HELO|nr:hypothetical protein HYALB_00012951 [Hymenoscyphus albidus]